MGTNKKKYLKQKLHDPKRSLQKYKANHRDKYLANKDQILEIMTRKGRIRIRLLPATWGQVIAWALVNSVAVFVAKLLIIFMLGKPSKDFITPSNETAYQNRNSVEQIDTLDREQLEDNFRATAYRDLPDRF